MVVEMYGEIGTVGNKGMMVVARSPATLPAWLVEPLDAESRRSGDAERESQMLDGGPLNRTTGRIVGAAIQVHSALGPGLLESVYETCLAFELREQGLFVQTQVPVPVVYKGISLDAGYRADMIVEHAIVVDIKSVSRILPVHKAQVLTYLRLLDHRIGLLLNFYVPVMRDGIRRVVNRPETTCIPASPLPRVSASSSDQSRTKERARPLQPGPEHRRQKT